MSNNVKKPKKKMRKRTKFTILAIFNIVWYTIAVMILSYYGTVIPSELTIGWYSAWTVELALLYGIKVRSKDATDDGGQEYNEIETEDEAIEAYNEAIDCQDAASTPDYDENVG